MRLGHGRIELIEPVLTRGRPGEKRKLQLPDRPAVRRGLQLVVDAAALVRLRPIRASLQFRHAGPRRIPPRGRPIGGDRHRARLTRRAMILLFLFIARIQNM